MALVLTIFGLVGLVIFVVFALLWLLQPTVPRRASNGSIAVIGLVIWAIATIIATLIALF